LHKENWRTICNTGELLVCCCSNLRGGIPGHGGWEASTTDRYARLCRIKLFVDKSFASKCERFQRRPNKAVSDVVDGYDFWQGVALRQRREVTYYSSISLKRMAIKLRAFRRFRFRRDKGLTKLRRRSDRDMASHTGGRCRVYTRKCRHLLALRSTSAEAETLDEATKVVSRAQEKSSVEALRGVHRWSCAYSRICWLVG
jgi:hypothetical protein